MSSAAAPHLNRPWRAVIFGTAFVALMVWVITYHATLGNAIAQLSTLPGPSWSAILIALGAVVASYCCSAVALSAAAGRRLPLGRTLLVQFAAAAANRLTPGGVGGMAVNARYLRTQELSSGTVGAALSLSALAHIAIASIGALVMAPTLSQAADSALTPHWSDLRPSDDRSGTRRCAVNRVVDCADGSKPAAASTVAWQSGSVTREAPCRVQAASPSASRYFLRRRRASRRPICWRCLRPPGRLTATSPIGVSRLSTW